MLPRRHQRSAHIQPGIMARVGTIYCTIRKNMDSVELFIYLFIYLLHFSAISTTDILTVIFMCLCHRDFIYLFIC